MKSENLIALPVRFIIGVIIVVFIYRHCGNKVIIIFLYLPRIKNDLLWLY